MRKAVWNVMSVEEVGGRTDRLVEHPGNPMRRQDAVDAARLLSVSVARVWVVHDQHCLRIFESPSEAAHRMAAREQACRPFSLVSA